MIQGKSQNNQSIKTKSDWLIDKIAFYAVSAIFQPCNGGDY